MQFIIFDNCYINIIIYNYIRKCNIIINYNDNNNDDNPIYTRISNLKIINY